MNHLKLLLKNWRLCQRADLYYEVFIFNQKDFIFFTKQFVEYIKWYYEYIFTL